MAVFKVKYKQLGGHVHCRVFSAPERHYTYAKNGELVFSVEEWDAAYTAFNFGGFDLEEDK